MSKTKVSYFENVNDTVPKTIILEKWLKQTIKPPKELKQKVLKYRNLQSKSAKLKIPCITVSARFKKVRNLDNIKEKTNLICLDIDRYSKKSKCNICIDFKKTKELLSQFKSTMFVGYSVSSDGENVSNGIYVIIKTHPKDSLSKVFKFYRKKLSRVGINIDESCKDYTRLRFFSYDPSAYFNPDAVAYKIPSQKKVKYKAVNASKSDIEKVENVVKLIEENSIDITSDYEDWYRIAGSLYNAFGDNGRQYFHRISKYYPDYKYKKADRKFDGCRNMKNVSLSTFFHIATKHGIRY